jgi:predicted RNA-binding Zn-ribbon protein involved in translation (DUF1610 family)
MCSRKITCTRCGHETGETEEQQNSHPQPCPHCGSEERTVHVDVSDDLKVDVKEEVVRKIKVDSYRSKDKIRNVLFSGDDLHHQSGKWNKKERVIDRDNDSYKEIVSDPTTGEVIHRCEERLSDHQGHGSAKKKRDNDNEKA